MRAPSTQWSQSRVEADRYRRTDARTHQKLVRPGGAVQAQATSTCRLLAPGSTRSVAASRTE